MELCVRILGDVLELLFRKDIGPTLHDVTEVMLRVLRTVIQAAVHMDRDNPLVVRTRPRPTTWPLGFLLVATFSEPKHLAP